MPGDAPAMQRPEKSVSHAGSFGAVAPPILLIIAVLGAILGGIASPNEAASVGGGGRDPARGLQTGRRRAG